MPRGAVAGSLGAIGKSDVPLTFDSFKLATDIGPIHGTDFTNVQAWGPVFRNGFGFRPVVDVLLHGARWWHPGVQEWLKPLPWPDILTASLWVALAVPTSPALISVEAEIGASWETPPHWETIMFAEPILLTAATVYNLSTSITTEAGTMTIARQEAMFVDQEPSLNGLLEAIQPTSHYDTASAIEETPYSTADAWYWLDPLVTAA